MEKMIIITEATREKRSSPWEDADGVVDLYCTSHTRRFCSIRAGKEFSSRVTPLFSNNGGSSSRRNGVKVQQYQLIPITTLLIAQPSSSQPQRKQKSRRWAVNEEPVCKLKELIDFCTNKLQQRVLDLEHTKIAQAQESYKFKKRVKTLEKKGGNIVGKAVDVTDAVTIPVSAATKTNVDTYFGSNTGSDEEYKQQFDGRRWLPMERAREVKRATLLGTMSFKPKECSWRKKEAFVLKEQKKRDRPTTRVQQRILCSYTKFQESRSNGRKQFKELQQESTKKQKMDDDLERKERSGYYQIIRADGSSRRYSAFIQILRSFNREDLETLWKLVKAKHGYTRPEEGYERVL
ncbi:hypothetical protein Tco_0877993 [Tanacetum coccineum]|uniref:Uncharacterized protein n=1 Tax=Tanacetum coccineum TaxID=301880 RepID=A0ABQ5BZT2_9ASTR